MSAPRTSWLVLVLLLAAAGPATALRPPPTVRVGVYQNRPKVALDPAGKPEGIFIDLIEEIARAEEWKLVYVPGTWAEGLDRLATGNLDLMPDVALSDERQLQYAFHDEPVLSSWFQIYARRGARIRSLVDLDGRRIALLDGSIQQAAFQRLVKGFDLETPLLAYPDYEAAFAALAAGQADAVIANRFYDAARYRALVEDTGIVFHPNRLFFAAPRNGNPAVLAAIDRHLRRMKQDRSSVYYRSFERWTAAAIPFHLPGWLKTAAAAAAAFLLLSLAWSFALRRQVAFRTRELQARKDETERLYEALQEREQRFRSFVENANDIVLSLTPDGRFAYVSPNWTDFLGHAAADVLGRSYGEFIHPDDLAACQAAMESARRGDKPSGIEFRMRHRDGSWRWFAANGAFVRDASGKDGHYLAIVRDTTGRRQAEEQLRLHAQLLNGVREAVVATDLDGRILYWGRGAEQLYGYSAAEVLGRPYRDFAGPLEPPDEDAFRRLLAEQGSWTGEHMQKNRQGETFWTSTFISVVLDDAGQPAGYIGIDQDITGRKQSEEAQRESQAHFAKLFDANPSGLMLVEKASRRIVQVNPAAAALIGLPPDRIAGQVCHGFMCPAESNTCPVCDLGQAVDRSERILVRADGTRLPVLKTVVPLSLGGQEHLLECFIDISERKKAEEKLLVFQALVAHSSDAVGISTPDGTHYYQNEAFDRLFGDIGPHPAQTLYADPAVGQAVFAAIQAGGQWQGEVRMYRRDRTLLDILLRAYAIRDARGAILGLAGLHTDITEIRRAETALRHSEWMLREAQRVAALGSYVLDIPANDWTASDELLAIFGLPPGEPRSLQTWENLLHPDDRAGMSAYFRDEVLGRGRPFNREYRIVRASDQAVRWVQGIGRLEFDGDGRPVRMIGTIQDITDRKRAEADKARLEEDLQQARKMESIGRLAGGVAHDFNNILGAILGYAELMLADIDARHPFYDDLLEVRKAAERAADLTRQLLAFARKQPILPRPLDLNATMADTLKMLRRLIGENIEIAWRPGPEPETVLLDPSQLDQILANLCVNAGEAISGAGRITIETGHVRLPADDPARPPDCPPGDYAVLTIADTGCGMDKETLNRLFEPFFTTKEMGKGTGLGLATVHGIVHQNGGFIDVQSKPGRGSVFRIHLPRHKAPEPGA